MPGNTNEHTSETLKGAMNLVETPETPIFIAGGPSSSEQLNAFRDHLVEDVVELDRRTRDQQDDIELAKTIFNVISTSIVTNLQSVNARLPATTGRWLSDFFTNDSLYELTTDADVNNTYGQVTLRILSEQEKLVGRDSRNQVWIPKNAQVSYSYKASAPDEVDWLTDENTVKALDQRNDTAWWRDRGSSGTVWVRVRVPTNLNANKFANAILLHPYPPLTYDLVSVEYRNPAGVYTAADLTYLENWDSGKGLVESVGNVRIFIPQTQVTELRLRLNTSGHWGFSRLSLKQYEFAPTSTLTVDFEPFQPGGISTVNLFGRDQDALAFLTTQVNGAAPVLLVSVQLAQNTQNTSPVITGVEGVQ